MDQALAEVGIPRGEVYITNAVKHFKWEPQGKRRKHKRPSASEITACKPWLEAELTAIRPKLVVALGATAIQSLFGRTIRLGDERGNVHPNLWGLPTLITIHPSATSAIFRHPEKAERDAEYRPSSGIFA